MANPGLCNSFPLVPSPMADTYHRCMEEPDPVDCKVEEKPYQITHSPEWSSVSPTSPVGTSFPASSLYPLAHEHDVGYTRGDGSTRWPVPAEDHGASPMGRPNTAWSPIPSPTLSSTSHSQHHQHSRRRDSNLLPQTESWSSLHSHSNRWQSSTLYDSMPSSGSYVDRTRLRSSNGYEPAAGLPHRRETEALPGGFGGRYSGHVSGVRDIGSQRQSWHTREVPGPEKTGHSVHSGHSFSPSPTLPFSPDGYHQPYHAVWSSGDGSLLNNSPSLQPNTTPSVMRPYEPSFAPGPGAMSSHEAFTSVDDYVK